jgi:hypothetical protein
MRGHPLSLCILLFSKIEIERALVALALGTKNPREFGRLVLVVKPSTLAGHSGSNLFLLG